MGKELFETLPDVLDAKLLASALSISKAGAYQLLNRPDFPTLQVGGRKLVTNGDAESGISAMLKVRELKKEWSGELTEDVLRKIIEENVRISQTPEAKSNDFRQNDIAYSQRQGFMDIRDLLNCDYGEFNDYNYYLADSLSPDEAVDFYSNRIKNLKNWLETDGKDQFSEKEKSYLIRAYEKMKTPLYYDYQAGWKNLFQYSPSIIMILTLVLGFLCAGIFSGEFQLKANAVFYSSYYGRNKAVWAKVKAGAIIITAIYWAVMLLYTMPSKENEIAVDREMVNKYFSNTAIGDKISFQINGKSQDFVISGITESSTESQGNYSCYVSKSFVENSPNYNPEKYQSYVCFADADSTSKEILKERIASIGKEIGADYSLSFLFFRENMGLSFENILTFVSLSVLVLFAGITVIQSIFRISINEKIRNFGQLRTLGTTALQIKKMINYESRYLSWLGIPPGIVLGAIVGTVLGSNEFSSGFSPINIPFVMIGVSIICTLMVKLSVRKPLKIAATTSPIEAVRYIAYRNAPMQSRKHNKKISPYSLALLNLGRDKKKTASTLLSLIFGGLSLKQLYRSLITEGLLYVLVSFGIVLLVGIPIAIPVSKAVGILFGMPNLSYQFPTMQIGGYLLILILLQLILSVWEIRDLKKRSLTEQMRAME